MVFCEILHRLYLESKKEKKFYLIVKLLFQVISHIKYKKKKKTVLDFYEMHQMVMKCNSQTFVFCCYFLYMTSSDY